LFAKGDKIILEVKEGKQYTLSDKNYGRTKKNNYMVWALPDETHCLVCNFRKYEIAQQTIYEVLTPTLIWQNDLDWEAPEEDLGELTCKYVSNWNWSPYYLTQDEKWHNNKSMRLFANDDKIIFQVKEGEQYALSEEKYGETKENNYMVWVLPDKKYVLICNFPGYMSAQQTIAYELSGDISGRI